MRRAAIPALLAVLVLGSLSPARSADDALSLWRENRRLAAESVLAATPKPYFELDLEHRSISLKTRGMVLFELPVQEQALWGRRLAVGPTSVVRRDALSRPAVAIGDEKNPATLDDQLLELADMPATYRLGLAGDVDVEILPVPTERWPVLFQKLGFGSWQLARRQLMRPLVTLRQRRERHETTAVFLVLKPEDARRLYWCLFEGLDGILIPPR